ncbi:MAG: hypothetical protein AB9917_00230 [Negativicutes bacterium]
MNRSEAECERLQAKMQRTGAFPQEAAKAQAETKRRNEKATTVRRR